MLLLSLMVGAGSAESRTPRLRWTKPVAVDERGGGLTAISCPSKALCVAVDAKGNVVTSTHPTRRSAAAWRSTGARVGQSGIECASVSLCVAYHGQTLFTSTDATGAAAAWPGANLDRSGRLTSVACPSSTFCVAGDDSGDILTTSEPGGGASAWLSAAVDPAAHDGQGSIYAVSCPSTHFCAAVDDQGNVLTSSKPAGGAPAWQIKPVDTGFGSGFGLLDISCPSARLCVAVDGSGGDVVWSTHPTRGKSAWKGAAISPAINENDEGRLELVWCKSTALCVAADNLGGVFVASRPTSGAKAWSTRHFGLAALSCISASLCVAVDADGSVRLGKSRRRT